MEPLYAADTDDVRTCSLDIRAHAVQEVRHVYHMGLLGRVLNDGISFRHSGRHHNVDGGSHGNHIQINMASAQSLRLRHNKSILNLYVSAQSAETLQVLINGSASDIAAARKGNLRPLILSKQSPQQIVGSADPLDILVIYAEIPYLGTIYLHRMPVNPIYIRANLLHRFQKDVDVPHIRKIFHHYCLIRHNRSRKNRQRSVLRSANLHLSHKRAAAFNHILFHNFSQLFLILFPVISII